MGVQTSATATRRSTSALKITVDRDIAFDLRVEAKRRGIEFERFAAEILDAVVTHKLYAAVLDQ